MVVLALSSPACACGFLFFFPGHLWGRKEQVSALGASHSLSFGSFSLQGALGREKESFGVALIQSDYPRSRKSY